jgi:thioredoxin 1
MIKIIRFTGEWCQPCKALAPIMNDIQNEQQGVMFETIDVDQNKDAVSLYKVSSVPTVVITKNGTEVTRFTGIKPKAAIHNLINQYK